VCAAWNVQMWWWRLWYTATGLYPGRAYKDPLSLCVPQNQVTCEQRPWLWLVSFFPAAPAADAHMAKAEYHFRVSAKFPHQIINIWAALNCACKHAERTFIFCFLLCDQRAVLFISRGERGPYARGCLFSIYVASLFDGGTAMRAVCQFRPWSEWCLCVYEREHTRKWKRAAGGNVENWPRMLWN
jgi:hypothetical protein